VLNCAGALASAFTCEDGDAEAKAQLTAVAIAEAWVKVLTEINTFCNSKGQASACSLAESSISAMAAAQAQAFADAWAGTVGACGCLVDLSVAASAIAKVLVQVTLEVHKSVCVKGAVPWSASCHFSVFL
jgi:hypothetical protein